MDEREFYDARYRELTRFFRGKVPPSEMWDSIQNTLEVFFEKEGASKLHPPSYMYRIARYEVLKARARSRPNEHFDSAKHAIAYESVSPSVRIDRRMRAHGALEALPLDQRIAFELRHLVGLELKEVADAIEVSLATIKRYLDAAEADLERQLAGTAYARDLAASYRDPP